MKPAVGKVKGICKLPMKSPHGDSLKMPAALPPSAAVSKTSPPNKSVPRTSPSNTKSPRALNKSGNDWRKTLSTDEGIAVSDYMGGDYARINGGLRKDAIPRQWRKTVSDLDSALGRARVPGTGTVYRGVNGADNVTKLFGGDPSASVGKIIHDKEELDKLKK